MVPMDEVVFDQLLQMIEDLTARHIAEGHDPLGGFEIEPAADDRGTFEQCPGARFQMGD